MYVIKESLVDEQVVCWNCEEMVHESALQCPYCNVELQKHVLQKAFSPTPKITPITQYAAVQETIPQQQHEHSETGSTAAFIVSLFLFLGGSAFLFLATMVFFFSQNGSFTISWPSHIASAFLGLGMASVAFGTLFFQRLSSASEE